MKRLTNLINKKIGIKFKSSSINNNDLTYIMITLFLIIILVIIYLCYTRYLNSNNKNNNEGFQSNSMLYDVILGVDENKKIRNSIFDNSNGICVYSTYRTAITNQNDIKNKNDIMSFWTPKMMINDYNYFVGHVVLVDPSISSHLSHSNLPKLNFEKMEINEMENTKITDNNMKRKILINGLNKLLKSSDEINTDFTFNILRSLNIIDESDNYKYDISKLVTLFSDKDLRKLKEYEKSATKFNDKKYQGLSSYKKLDYNQKYFIKKIHNLEGVNIDYFNTRFNQEKT